MAEKIEARLRRYPEDLARLKVLEERISALKADIEMERESSAEYIQGECLQSSLGRVGMSSNQLSNPTERVALANNDATGNLKPLEREAGRLSHSISALTYALDGLPERVRYVLEQRYFQRKEWPHVLRSMADKYDVYSRPTMFRYHREGLEQIQRTITGNIGGWPKKKWGDKHGRGA